jgi:hypothetical protein
MSIQQEILQFAAALPVWEQDLVRRLATQASLIDTELDEIQAMLYAEHKVPLAAPALSPVPISKADLPAAELALPKTTILLLKDVAHTNRLANDQILPFGVEGLTIIYGDNGSGKTGYGRLLKALCRARRDRIEPILNNVYGAATKKPAQATIIFLSESEKHVVAWTDGTPPPAELCRISVFDAATAPLYADRQNQIEFLPQGLDILPRLGSTLTKFAGRIDEELNALRQLAAAPLPQAPAGTKAAALLQKLNLPSSKSLPTPGDLQAEAGWDDLAETHLADVASQLQALAEPGKLAASVVRRK